MRALTPPLAAGYRWLIVAIFLAVVLICSGIVACYACRAIRATFRNARSADGVSALRRSDTGGEQKLRYFKGHNILQRKKCAQYSDEAKRLSTRGMAARLTIRLKMCVRARAIDDFHTQIDYFSTG